MRVIARVFEEWRREIRRHHTSAHLLQRALKDVLGDEVNQAGSWVGIDRMRFDFRWPRGALTPEQRRAVAHRVNEMIRDDAHLVTRVLPLEEAKKTGAVWMAGEKYGEHDPRRAGRAVDSNFAAARTRIRPASSACSSSSPNLRSAAASAESSRASRLRPRSTSRKQSELIGTLSSTMSAAPEELHDRVERMQRDVKDLQTALGQLRARIAASEAEHYVERAERKGDRAFVGAVVPEADGEALRQLGNAIRSKLRSGVVALAGIDNGSVSLLGQRERGSDRCKACMPATW